MALVIQLIVGELELVKADHLSHPGVPRGEWVRVDIDPGWHGRVGIPRHHPLGAVVHIPVWRIQEAWVGAMVSYVSEGCTRVAQMTVGELDEAVSTLLIMVLPCVDHHQWSHLTWATCIFNSPSYTVSVSTVVIFFLLVEQLTCEKFQNTDAVNVLKCVHKYLMCWNTELNSCIC